jgi:hypothetical protein
VFSTAAEHAYQHHVTAKWSLARRNVIKTNDCQTDVTQCYVKQEMMQAYRDTQKLLTASDKWSQ